MISALKALTITLVLGGSCLAQDGLVIRGNGKQVWSGEAEKVYLSACSAVERQFRITRSVKPRVTLVVGAREDRAYLESREIRLTRWDPYMFAQGVVIFAFEDLLPERERIAVAHRGVKWAGSTVDIKSLAR